MRGKPLSVYASDHVALAFLVAHPGATSARLARELDWTATWAATRLRALERAGLAQAELGDGGSFRWTVTPAGSARLAELPRPPFEDVGGPLARFGRQAAS